MSTRAKSSNARFAPTRFLLSAAAAMLLCGCSTLRPQTPPQPQPLVEVSCPLLAPLDDGTFGAWVLYAQYVKAQYGECRKAALAQ